MSALALAIETMVVEGVGDPEDDPELAAALDAWHERANRRYEPVEFRAYYGSMRIEDFVAGALAPVAGFVDDLTFEEARMLLVAITSAKLPMAQTDHYLALLDANLPGANLSDLIFWPDEWFGDPDALHIELTPEQTLTFAMGRAARTLTGAPDVELPRRDPKTR